MLTVTVPGKTGKQTVH